VSDVYRQALAKQEWAEQHIAKLQTAVDVWRKSDPCTIGVKQDTKTGDITYCVEYVPVVPGDISLIIGDILHSLRGALDYMACGMVVAGGGKVTASTKFPILEAAADWEVRVLGMVKGAHQYAIEALRRIQPYKGGNPYLFTLQRLNNIDKHRLLLAVSLVNAGRTIGPNEIAAEVQRTEPGIITNSPRGRVRFSARKTPAVPLHVGQELLTVPIAHFDEQMGFFVDVTIGEPGLAEGTPATLLLRLMSAEVNMILVDLARFV